MLPYFGCHPISLAISLALSLPLLLLDAKNTYIQKRLHTYIHTYIHVYIDILGIKYGKRLAFVFTHGMKTDFILKSTMSWFEPSFKLQTERITNSNFYLEIRVNTEWISVYRKARTGVNDTKTTEMEEKKEEEGQMFMAIEWIHYCLRKLYAHAKKQV